jgi:hypothetical protein
LRDRDLDLLRDDSGLHVIVLDPIRRPMMRLEMVSDDPSLRHILTVYFCQRGNADQQKTTDLHQITSIPVILTRLGTRRCQNMISVMPLKIFCLCHEGTISRFYVIQTSTSIYNVSFNVYNIVEHEWQFLMHSS